MPMPAAIEIAGRTWPVSQPGFAEREELVQGMLRATERLDRAPGLVLRVGAAAIGLCTSVGQSAGTSYARANYDLLEFGGRVYDWLRRQGVSAEEVARVGAQVIQACATDLFPRESEVKARTDFSGAPGAPTS